MRCSDVYKEARLIKMFIEGLHEPIRGTVRSYWAKHPKADLNTLARYALLVARLTHQNGVAFVELHDQLQQSLMHDI